MGFTNKSAAAGLKKEKLIGFNDDSDAARICEKTPFFAMNDQASAGICPMAALASERRVWLAFLISRGASTDEAEDVLQSAFLKAATQSERILDLEKLKSWFYTVLRNSLVDYQRSRSSARMREAAWVDEQLIRSLESNNEPLPTCRCFLRRFNAIHPRYAKIIREIHLAGKPVAAYARETNQKVESVHLAIHRARKAMKKELYAFCGVCAVGGQCMNCSCE